VDVSRRGRADAATINLRDLGGLTVTEALHINDVPTGRLHRSVVIILNVLSGDNKQSVIEHELAHALGVQGHAKSILWTRMSQEGESIAPLARHSSFDRQLLRILYSKLLPGDSGARVADVVKQGWRFEPNRQSKNMPKWVGDIGARQNNGETIEGVHLVRGLACEMEITITKTIEGNVRRPTRRKQAPTPAALPSPR
jgi:hypothetical protein